MASLTIRKLDEELKALLRLRAASHGRSVEDEVRVILREAADQREASASAPQSQPAPRRHAPATASGKERVTLIIGGGIAAYKALELVRLLVKAGADVRCALTRAAKEFVQPLSFQALSGRPVATDLFDASQELAAGHIALSDWAELAVIAPATADLLARARLGLADDVVTATLLAIPPERTLFAPAMNERMWASPAVAETMAALKARGCSTIGPNAGEMAERSHVGLGRLAEAAEIAAACAQKLATLAPRPIPSHLHDGPAQPRAWDLENVPVLVSAGPTREHLDPVRFLSNPSTGRMGFALAEAARDRGARVTLVCGPTELAPPTGVEVVRVESALEMQAAIEPRAAQQRAIVMAAAVSDQRPAERAQQKQKKPDGDEHLRLVRTPDILRGLGERFLNATPRPLLIGFAAETERVEEFARAKLVAKHLDLIVANDVSGAEAGFAALENRVVVLDKDGGRAQFAGPKLAVAHHLWDEIARRL
ncbi:MAG: bifunctional phosphopantothenoylcysteine decarboxylase/phosphopantothenate--cysteine ligase CoaBC [Deltaproteobacteria bacterium]|nr:bifunctional phosphopantothenoylcysteine decarboxylase/phosphopantothenate--cysteine ligase CoaBC [Deltaproteobacteria bacterium]